MKYSLNNKKKEKKTWVKYRRMFPYDAFIEFLYHS